VPVPGPAAGVSLPEPAIRVSLANPATGLALPLPAAGVGLADASFCRCRHSGFGEAAELAAAGSLGEPADGMSVAELAELLLANPAGVLGPEPADGIGVAEPAAGIAGPFGTAAHGKNAGGTEPSCPVLPGEGVNSSTSGPLAGVVLAPGCQTPACWTI
jgi:hypothetical protein